MVCTYDPIFIPQMVFFAFAMMWAYPASEYNKDRYPKMSWWRAIVDSLNFGTPPSTDLGGSCLTQLPVSSADFACEIYTSLKFFIDYVRRKPYTRTKKGEFEHKRVDFAEAFRCSSFSSMVSSV